MIEKITQKELALFETLNHPISCAEILFHDVDDLGSFNEKEYGKIREYQIPFQAYTSLCCEDKEKSKKENFKHKKGFGECYALGGRGTGKTRIFIIIDALIALWNKTFKWGIISSGDADHVRDIMEKIIIALEFHPVLKMLNAHILRSPSYKINTQNGCLLESVNNNLAGKNPGQHWYGKHCDINWEEEASFLTDEISHKKARGCSELGIVNRFSGMTTFSKNSPMGRVFYNLYNESKLVNIPSYANPYWDEEEDKKSIEEFGGKNSQSYQVQVVGKVVEGGDTVLDMERIRATYKRDKKGNPVPIKAFEINKDNFFKFKDELILSRPSNATKCIVALDKGEGAAPTEIIIIFQTNEIYTYHYNVTCYKLKVDEDEAVINYVIELVKPNIIGIDATSGTGKVLCSALSKKYPGNIIGVSFNEKIAVDFERDEEGNLKYDKHGKTIYKQEYIVDWSIQQLKHLFYNKKIKCFMDYKLDTQFGGVVVMKSGMRTVYGYKTENHLFQAFQVFSIIHWMTEFKTIQPIKKKKLGFGAFGSI